jgi:hypothetical protein
MAVCGIPARVRSPRDARGGYIFGSRIPAQQLSSSLIEMTSAMGFRKFASTTNSEVLVCMLQDVVEFLTEPDREKMSAVEAQVRSDFADVLPETAAPGPAA